MALRVPTAPMGRDRISTSGRLDHLLQRVDHEAGAVTDHLCGGTAPERDYRRPARERLCEDTTERLVPLDGCQQGPSCRHPLQALVAKFPQVLDPPAQVGRDLSAEVLVVQG